MTTPRLRGLRRVLALAVLALVAAGCSETSAGGFSQVTSAQILDGSTVLATVSGTSVTGSVPLTVGNTRNLTLRYFDSDGDRVVPNLNERMDAFVVNEVLVEFSRGTQTAEGDLTITLRGVAPGSTGIQLLLFSGFAAIFQSPAIPVTVT